MQPRIGIQLYTLREEMKENPIQTLEAVAALGYEGVEFAGFYGIEAEVMKQELARLGLTVIASHTSLELLENELEAVVTYNQIIGNRVIVCPWTETKDAESLKQMIPRLKAVAIKIKAQGMVFLYHNHEHELQQVDGKVCLQHLVEGLKGDMQLEVDTFWVCRSGLDPVAYLRNNKEVIRLVHLKDGTDKTLCALGEGHAPIQAIQEQVVKMGLKWVIVENDQPTPTGLEDCKRSIAYLKTIR